MSVDYTLVRPGGLMMSAFKMVLFDSVAAPFLGEHIPGFPGMVPVWTLEDRLTFLAINSEIKLT